MGKVGTKSIFLVTPVGSVTSKPDLLCCIDYRVLFGHIASPHPHHFDEYPHLCFNLNWWYFFIFNKTLKETENFCLLYLLRQLKCHFWHHLRYCQHPKLLKWQCSNFLNTKISLFWQNYCHWSCHNDFCQNYLRYMISEVKVLNNRMDK